MQSQIRLYRHSNRRYIPLSRGFASLKGGYMSLFPGTLNGVTVGSGPAVWILNMIIPRMT